MSEDSLVVWPDGGWCYWYEFKLYPQDYSDDYIIIKEDDPRYEEILTAEGVL